MNTNTKTKYGTVQQLREFYERDFQEYEPGKVFAPFTVSPHSEYSCGNPVIVGYIKTGKLAWMEQWIEVCKSADNGKYGYGYNTCSDTCEGHSSGPGCRHCFVHFPHENYSRFYTFDSVEDAIRGAIQFAEKILAERGDAHNKGTRKMLALALSQLQAPEPTCTQLSLF